MVDARVFLDRMRGNAALALAAGAQPADVFAHALAVMRPGLTRPGANEIADGEEVAELAAAMNDFRSTAPGEVSDV